MFISIHGMPGEIRAEGLRVHYEILDPLVQMILLPAADIAFGQIDPFFQAGFQLVKRFDGPAENIRDGMGVQCFPAYPVSAGGHAG